MAIREGTITTSAMEDIINASRIILQDVLDDGGTRTDAFKFIKKLVVKGMKQV